MQEETRLLNAERRVKVEVREQFHGFPKWQVKENGREMEGYK